MDDTPKTPPWTLEEDEAILRTRVFTVHRRRRRSALRPERVADFYVMECADWVNVIALTDDARVVMVEQYRQGTDDITLEIPGGLVDPGEGPLEAGLRELREETGFASDRPGALIGCVAPNPALQSNRCHTALVRGVARVGAQDLDNNEEIAVRCVPLGEIPGLIRAGVITHALVVAAFHHLSLIEEPPTSPAG
jgi:ADP-ribose pyrophosphatase